MGELAGDRPDARLLWAVMLLNTAITAHFLSQDVVGVLLVLVVVWVLAGGSVPTSLTSVPAERLVRLVLAFHVALGAVAAARELVDGAVVVLVLALVALGVIAYAALRMSWPGHAGLREGMLLLVGLGVLLGCWLTLPARIDVHVFQDVAADRLLQGVNPYAFGYPDVYGAAESAKVYAPGISVDGVLQAGFPYPPVSLVLSTVGAVLGDVRLAHALAIILAVLLMATLSRRSWAARVGAVLFATSPLVPYVVQRAWTEPFVVAALALVIWAGRRGGLGVLPLALLLSVKQYAVVLLPVIVGLAPRPRALIERMRSAVGAVLLAALTAVPFLAIGAREFVYSVGLWQLDQPFRTDAMSVPSVVSRWAGVPPSWLQLVVIGLATAGAIGWALTRLPAGWGSAALGVTTTMLVFLVVGKQAFTNYYTFALGALCLAIAAGARAPSSLVGLERGAIADPEDVHGDQDRDQP